jgi:hypothetical protein
MRNNLREHSTAILALAFAVWLFLAASESVMAQSTQIEDTMSPNGGVRTLDLTASQKVEIYQEARKDRNKVAPSRFAAEVGAEVPPMIALYPLPDAVLSNEPVTRLYQYTRVEDKVVLVDPIRMCVVAVIGPEPGE